jgi:hypothetical protein
MKQMARDFSYLMFHSIHLHPRKSKHIAKKVIYLFHVWTTPPKEPDKIDCRCGSRSGAPAL